MVIRESFIALLKEKPIAKITVKEICTGADINRATFYAHYADPYALLHEIEESLIHDVQQYLTENAETDDVAMLSKIFQYIRANADMCSVLLSDYSDTYFQRLLRELVEHALGLKLRGGSAFSEEDSAFVLTFVLTGCVGIAQHRLHLFVRAMVVALVVAFETAAKQILIYINRAERIVCHRDMYGYHIIPLKINALYILLYQDIPAHLIAVYGIPK